MKQSQFSVILYVFCISAKRIQLIIKCLFKNNFSDIDNLNNNLNNNRDNLDNNFVCVYEQVWACSFLPNEPAIKERTQREYFAQNGQPMLVNYLEKELIKKVRLFHCTLWLYFNY